MRFSRQQVRTTHTRDGGEYRDAKTRKGRGTGLVAVGIAEPCDNTEGVNERCELGVLKRDELEHVISTEGVKTVWIASPSQRASSRRPGVNKKRGPMQVESLQRPAVEETGLVQLPKPSVTHEEISVVSAPTTYVRPQCSCSCPLKSIL